MNAKELLIFEAARLCYKLDISQQEIAKTLGISPATLTRLLQKAKELGIIKITVQPPYEYVKDLDDFTLKAKKKLGIDEVIIVPSSLQPKVVRKELGYAAGRWLSVILSDGMTVGFSGGRSVAEIIPFLKRTHEGIQVVQLMGGVSPTEKIIQADFIARNAASRLGGTCHVIHGPAIFPDEVSLSQLLKNKIVLDVIKQFESLDISIVGLRTLTNDNPLMQCGFLNDEEIKHLTQLGCVGDICGHFFNCKGEECDPELTKRVLGIRLGQLKRTPKVCAIAGGIEKVPVILAACRAKILKTLITDIATASEIVKLNK